MSELYSGKYAPPPVKVVGYWARRNRDRDTIGPNMFLRYGLTAQAAARAGVNAFTIATDMSKQEREFERVFK